MQRFFLLSISLVLLSTSVASADSCFETRRQAFKDGFLSSQLSSNLLKTEFAKYQTSPELLLHYFRYLSQTQNETLFVLKFRREIDPLGRLLIRPFLQIKNFNAEDFPNASYLNGLLEYNKDFSQFYTKPAKNSAVDSEATKPKS